MTIAKTNTLFDWVYYYNNESSSSVLEFETIEGILTAKQAIYEIRIKSFIFYKHLKHESCMKQ